MSYGSFDEIELPNLTVTEANPAAWLDFYRFSSTQLTAYHTMQVNILRAFSPGRFITTNLMGFFYQFDAFNLATDTLDFAAVRLLPLPVSYVIIYLYLYIYFVFIYRFICQLLDFIFMYT